MAFSQSTLSQFGNGRPSSSINVYSYKSADNLAAVITAGYFTINPRIDLQAKDLIHAQLGDGYVVLEAVDEVSAVAA
jgi:hypothetical protein